MKKRFASVFALLSLLILLSACTIWDTDFSYSTRDDSIYSNDSFDISFETSIASEDITDIDCEALLEELLHLLTLDQKVIDIFANGALESELALDSLEFGEYGRLDANSRYYMYQSVLDLLDSVYTKDSLSIGHYLQSCPEYGPVALRMGDGGYTEVSFVYDADFVLDLENAHIKFSGKDDCLFEFLYSDGVYSFTVSAEETKNGLRLTDSTYYIDRAKKSSLPSVRDCAAENSGSAKALVGNCLIINMFASDSNSTWTKTDKDAVKEMLNEALSFIKQESESYAINDLNFIVIDTEFTVGTDALEFEYGSSYGETAFIGTKYAGIKDYTESVAANINYDSVCVLMHFNKHGRSYFVPSKWEYSLDSNWYYEFGVMYYSTPDDGIYYACPATYAHEILHGFGAQDLYEGFVSEKGEILIESLFPDDIMNVVPYNIYESKVGALTAKLVGWTQWLDPQLKEVLDECL